MIKKLIVMILLFVSLFFNSLKVNAYSNQDTEYDVNFNDLGYMHIDLSQYGDLISWIDNINDFESSYYNILIISDTFSSDLNQLPGYLRIFLISKSSYLYVDSYSNGSYHTFRFTIPAVRSYAINLSNFDYMSDLNNIYDCYVSNSCSNWYGGNTTYLEQQSINFLPISDFNNKDVNVSYYSTQKFHFLYYSSDVIISYPSTSTMESSSNYYKKLYINNTFYTSNDYLPLYMDMFVYNPPPEPEPEPEPTPIDGEIANSIYWFYDNSDSQGVLTNIYILLFLYCITIIIFKVYDKVLKNRNGRY